MSYTQQSFTVNINVRGMGVTGGTGNGTNNADPSTEENKLTTEESEQAKAAKQQAAKAKAASHNLAQMGAAFARQVLNAGVQYGISGIGMQTGDQFLQTQAQRKWNDTQVTINAVQGGLSGAATGAAAGAVFGGVGALVGAVAGGILGAASPLLSRGQEYATGQREYQYTVWKEQSNINYARVRAGAELNDGRRVR